MLTKEQIEKYKAIYEKEFGEEISDEKAIEQGEALVQLMKAVYKPIKRNSDIEGGVQN